MPNVWLLLEDNSDPDVSLQGVFSISSSLCLTWMHSIYLCSWQFGISGHLRLLQFKISIGVISLCTSYPFEWQQHGLDWLPHDCSKSYIPAGMEFVSLLEVEKRVWSCFCCWCLMRTETQEGRGQAGFSKHSSLLFPVRHLMLVVSGIVSHRSTFSKQHATHRGVWPQNSCSCFSYHYPYCWGRLSQGSCAKSPKYQHRPSAATPENLSHLFRTTLRQIPHCAALPPVPFITPENLIQINLQSVCYPTCPVHAWDSHFLSLSSSIQPTCRQPGAELAGEQLLFYFQRTKWASFQCVNPGTSLSLPIVS